MVSPSPSHRIETQVSQGSTGHPSTGTAPEHGNVPEPVNREDLVCETRGVGVGS